MSAAVTENGHTSTGVVETPRRGLPGSIDEAVAGKPARSGGRRAVALTVLALLFLAVGAGAGWYWLQGRAYESTDDAFVEGRVIPISPQVGARVAVVRVNDNAVVRKGDVLVELDKTDYQVADDQAKASASAARGKLKEAQTQVTAAHAGRAQAEAQLAVAEANAANAASDLKRYQALLAINRGAVSQQQMDAALSVQRSTEAQVAQAGAAVAAAEAQIATAEAAVDAAGGDVEKAVADVHRAEVNLSYCTIVAPEDGRVTRKNVEPGSNVQVGQDLFALVPDDVWVVANFKETQLDHMRAGQPVRISVDAYPDQRFTGKVDSIQSGTGSRFSVMPAENATGNFVKVVQRVPVKIVFDPGQTGNPDRVLAPGMSAEPRVTVR